MSLDSGSAMHGIILISVKGPGSVFVICQSDTKCKDPTITHLITKRVSVTGLPMGKTHFVMSSVNTGDDFRSTDFGFSVSISVDCCFIRILIWQYKHETVQIVALLYIIENII